MSFRLMFIINAAILAIFGIVFTIIPVTLLSEFKSEVYVATVYTARFLGGSLLMSGLLLWFLQDIPEYKQKVATYPLLAASASGFFLTLLGMTSVGVLRANGWVLLVIFGLFSLIYGYMLFLQPNPADAEPRAPRKMEDASYTNH